ncbi:MAG: NFACT family protein [Treponema sp.]|nr:NFACT family protein [Treponema sp.]
MSLNCNEINLILKELSIDGAYIQDIIQPGYDMLCLYTYKNGCAKTVLICTAQNSVRINQTNRKITKNSTPLRFMEYLKSHIKGSRIESIAQIGFERVIKLELSHTDAETEGRIKFNMYIKLWNNAANVLLCDENDVILESMYRRPKQNEIKGQKYIIPEIKSAADHEKFSIREWRAVPIVQNNSEGCPHCSTFNEFIDFWYSEYAQNLSRDSLIQKVEKWYAINHSKRTVALQNLEEKLHSFENASFYKHQGDLILSFGHQIAKDSLFLECDDYETGKKIRIKIDPDKSVQENANDYYKKYKKAVSGKEELKHDIEIARSQLEKLTESYNQMIKEPNPIKIEQLFRKNSTPKQKLKKTHPGLEYSVDGWTLYAGRDTNENDELLRHFVRGEDLWLHVRDYHGGYVFIKAKKGKTVPLDILLDAGNLAVYYSKARNNTKVDLYYTHVKYLRRAKYGPKGTVLPTQEKNLCITPDKERLKRLDISHKMME